MEKNEQEIDAACRLIADSLGKETAEQFKEFYKNKDRDTIIISVKDLLTDLIGPENTKKQIQGEVSINNIK